jgi:hypothetical protein
MCLNLLTIPFEAFLVTIVAWLTAATLQIPRSFSIEGEGAVLERCVVSIMGRDCAMRTKDCVKEGKGKAGDRDIKRTAPHGWQE